jgi:riboflavin kinase/FMN adenylyltransferase
MIAAIGAFDGFHKGHQALLERAGAIAGDAHHDWGVVTFTRHPAGILYSPEFRVLYTRHERSLLESYFRIPNIHEMEFTPQIAGMTPKEFLNFISDKFGISGIVVGEGFRFGANRAGSTDYLSAECRRRGWVLDVVPAVKDTAGAIISSTSIRDAVSAGDMALARESQGYHFFCAGRVVHGNERGRTLGFPTANMEMAREKTPVGRGVYAVMVNVCGKWFTGAANAGVNPTFDDVEGTRFEIFLIDFEGDIYDREIAVFPLARIRNERRFENASLLKEQMNLDVALARETGKFSLREDRVLWERFGKILIERDDL